jgi:hypothetical protein
LSEESEDDSDELGSYICGGPQGLSGKRVVGGKYEIQMLLA